MTEELNRVREAFEDWTLYDKIIQFNYMRHREIAEAVRSLADELRQPLHVLDLGCGDGWMASHALSGREVASYVGLDLSSGALDGAMKNLSSLSPSVSLRQADFRQALRDGFQPQPNLVLASYSLHHFRWEEVASLITNLRERMAARGCLAWIDLQRRGQESRDEFLQRFFEQVLTQWKALTHEQVDEVTDHMTSADFPRSAAEKRRLSEAAGFEVSRTIYQDDYYAADVYSFGQSD